MSRHLSNVTLEGGPSNLQLFFFFSSPRDLVFELRAAGMEGQKWKETSAQSRCMYIPRFGSCQTCPGCVSSAPPSAIIHHAVTHTHTRSEGRSAAHVSLLCGELLGERRRLGPLHNQLVPLCPKYLICINFIAACFILSALN